MTLECVDVARDIIRIKDHAGMIGKNIMNQTMSLKLKILIHLCLVIPTMIAL